MDHAPTPSRPSSFGELLRAHRLAAGLAQEALAELASVSVEAIGALERGTRQHPYRETITLIADALSLTQSDRVELERAARRTYSPPLRARSVETVRQSNTLPIHLSPFVGRVKEVERVIQMLAEHRLVTLVGPGGIGKTRLALQATTEYTNAEWGKRLNGVWFVDLAPLSDASMVAGAVATSVGLEGCAALEPLIGYLQNERFLLVLDNCEHVIDAVAHLADTILRRCEGTQLIASSREALAIEGERIYRVPPLSISDAIELFVQRAEAVDSRFVLSEELLPTVADVSRRLEGIALAIELAAARVNLFSVSTLAERLKQHFFVLSGGNRTTLPRHKTMRGLLDWSYDLLSEQEQRTFRKLAIFAGGFTLELATRMCVNDLDQDSVAAALFSLVDKSLVQTETGAETTRYRLLEPTRQYALEKLNEEREYDAAVRAHALALLAIAETHDALLKMTADAIWDAEFAPEAENFRTALEWAIGSRGDASVAQRLVGSRTASRCGFASAEVRTWVSAALKTCEATTPREVRARLALTAARSAINFESADVAVKAAQAALNLQEEMDLPAIAAAQYLLGAALFAMACMDQSAAVLSEALATAAACGAQKECFDATHLLAFVRYSAGDLDEARNLATEALRQSRSVGADLQSANAIMTLAEIEFANGSVEEALTLIREAADLFRNHRNPVRLSRALCNLSAYLVALKRYEEAQHYASEALQYARTISVSSDLPWMIQHLAAVALFGNDRDESCTQASLAAKLLGFVNDATARTGRWRNYTEQQEYNAMVSALREMFDEEQLAALMEDGKTWSEDRAVAEALSRKCEFSAPS